MNLDEVKSRSDIPRYLVAAGVTDRWCELGVAEGEYSRALLGFSPGILWSIDRWAGDRGHDTDQYLRAVRKLWSCRANNLIVRAEFQDVVPHVDTGYFDFIYIDVIFVSVIIPVFNIIGVFSINFIIYHIPNADCILSQR